MSKQKKRAKHRKYGDIVGGPPKPAAAMSNWLRIPVRGLPIVNNVGRGKRAR